MVRPIDTEVLQRISREIAMNNYGFLYLEDHVNEITERYEQAETGLRHKSSLSQSSLQSGLQEIAEDDFNSFEQLRGNAYYLNPFETRRGQQIGTELQSLFTANLVVNANKIQSQFRIAPTDVEFFTTQLLDEGYVSRIPAGERDYFVSGPRLADETAGDVSLESQLKTKADSHGRISHRELEEIIDVAATTNVIDYLEANDFIVELDDEYLVVSAVREFAESLATELSEVVADEFIESDYVLHTTEFRQVLENQINDRRDVLTQARGMKREIIDLTQEALINRLDLTEQQEMIIFYDEQLGAEGFAEFIEGQAETISSRVMNDSEVTVTKPSDQITAGEQLIEELQVGRTERSQTFIQDQIKQEYEQLVQDEWA